MKNKKYFTVESYVAFVKFARKNGYHLCPMRDALKHVKRKLVGIMRHDIDISLDVALKMARLESELNLRSTYFILLYNNRYNPLSPHGRKILREIKKLGHEIGIHWDSRDYQKKNWKKWFALDVKILEEIIEEKILSASQHEPTTTFRHSIGSLLEYDAYSNKLKDFIYVSDSGMRWRNISPWEIVEHKKHFHFLSHPFWWISSLKSRKEKIAHHSQSLSKLIKQEYDYYYKDTMQKLRNREKHDKYFNYKNKNLEVMK